MATVRGTINGALRKCGVLAAGREPRLADQQDTLAALKGLYQQWINNGTFGRLKDVLPLADYTANPNERVFRNKPAVTKITLPETVGLWWWDARDGFLHYDEERPVSLSGATTPPDCSVVSIADSFSGQVVDFIYDGGVRRWVGVYNLDLNDVAPLSERDPKGLEAALATQVCDEFGGELGALTLRQAGTFQSALASRFSMPARPALGVYM